MRIHLWIKEDQVESMSKFLSDDFGFDEEMKFDVWYTLPSLHPNQDKFIQISITPDQYAKLQMWEK